MKTFNSEEGYTLVETLIAMSIFVGVLIPLTASISNLLLWNDSGELRQALHVAESEVHRVLADPSIQSGRAGTQKFLMERKVERGGGLRKIIVSVALANEPDKAIVTLEKLTVSQYGQ